MSIYTILVHSVVSAWFADFVYFYNDLLPGAVKKAFDKMVDFFKTANTSEILQEFSVCNLQQPMSASLVADNLLFLAEQTFANLNMGNYPPNSETGRASLKWVMVFAKSWLAG